MINRCICTYFSDKSAIPKFPLFGLAGEILIVEIRASGITVCQRNFCVPAEVNCVHKGAGQQDLCAAGLSVCAGKIIIWISQHSQG